MPLNLDTLEQLSTTIDKLEINSFAVDLDRQEIIVAYDKLDADGVVRGEDVLIVDGPDFPAAIAQASQIAGADVYAALKQALYNQIIARTGKTGVIA